ncbi:uncharacterized protein LOC128165242 isoform X1 [Crassostrea angulata]|uniref:uncharacterized protein LOC128165242 isoform X1 n=3 Tax=Magallana angulata TaxID=2784310 RepID=UPI0022B1FAAD|nr:uncharacterized protein LOC128165242 isoform X1 [Crassostrea angulata]
MCRYTRLPVMERYGPHKWPPLPKLRVNVPPPPAPRNLESLADVCQEIFQLASDIALGQKKVVLCCSLGGQGISLDLCGAKAATVLCAIGIGFGIGSYLLYKLYCRLFPSDPKDREPVYTADKSCQRDQSNDADVEENEMGNSGSNETVPVRYDAVNGVQFGSCRTRNQATSPILVRQRRPTKHQRSHRRSSDVDETRLLNPHEDSSSRVQEDSVDRLIHSASDISAAEPNSGSLKGNLSLKSLYERNYKYGFDEHFQSSKAHLYDSSGDSLQIDVSSSQDLLTVSSVLLTPPSDDDRNNQNQEKLAGEQKPSVKFSENIPDLISNLSATDCKDLIGDEINVADQSVCVWQTTDSSNHTSPFHSSGSAKLFSNYTTDISGNLSVDDDEIDSSPLHRAKCPDGQFRQTLLQRLHEINTSSTSTSLNSSPDASPCRYARSNSCERQESLSGLSENEIFTESAEVGQSTGEYFEKIEHEVDDIVDEFADLTAKLDELKQLAAKHSSEDDMEYTPSDPLAKKACEFVEKAREKFHRSQSDTSLSESAVDTDGIDLSWDSEGQSQLKSLMKRVNSLPSKMVTESQGSYNNVDASDSEDKERKISTSDGAIIFLSDNFEACDKLLIGDSDVYSDQMDQGQTTLDELDTDSAFDMDPVELVSSREFSPGSLNIGPKQDILEYCKAEWRGQTKRASIMQKAYQEIPSLIECRHLHQVRGDNYCAIRGTLLQCFIQNINVLTKWNSAESVINRLQTLYRNPNSGLSQWTFAHRLPFNKKDKLPTMSECVQCLFAKFSECQSLSTNEERNSWPVNLLNLDTKVDLQCMEAIKLLMFLEAHSLYEASQKGDDVPVFVWLLFARDTSENPESLLKNHINPVGDSGGLEQIEMILLGHTLEVTIKVLRLQQYGEEDFVTYYPDDRRESWPLIVLIAEDDRHYNAPVV